MGSVLAKKRRLLQRQTNVDLAEEMFESKYVQRSPNTLHAKALAEKTFKYEAKFEKVNFIFLNFFLNFSKLN